MALWDKIRGELIDVIEWLDDSPDTMVWRFPRYDNEIKNGAKLIVRPSQVAAFINEGQIADVFGQPGTYTLETQNLPILSKLRGWKYGFQSPFKAEVYFVSTRTFTDRKWGTKNPIMLRDPEFGPVRLRAFGTFGVRVNNAENFLKQITGTSGRFSVESIGDQLRDMLVARFADVLGSSKIPVLDMAGNQDELAKYVLDRIAGDFEPFGIQIVNLFVENISLPPEVEQALDKRSSMGIIGNMQQFTQYQTANAISDAAKNPGGMAGAGVGIGFGAAMGQQIAQAASATSAANQPPPGGTAPPPLPQQVSYFAAINNQQLGPFDLQALKDKIAAGQITRQTLVWKQGMPQWTAAGQNADLEPLFSSVPPPLPPQA